MSQKHQYNIICSYWLFTRTIWTGKCTLIITLILYDPKYIKQLLTTRERQKISLDLKICYTQIIFTWFPNVHFNKNLLRKLFIGVRIFQSSFVSRSCSQWSVNSACINLVEAMSDKCWNKHSQRTLKLSVNIFLGMLCLPGNLLTWNVIVELLNKRDEWVLWCNLKMLRLGSQ